MVAEETVSKEMTGGEDQWPDLGNVVSGGMSHEEERKEKIQREEQARYTVQLVLLDGDKI